MDSILKSDTVISEGLNYLRSQQQRNGSFLSLSTQEGGYFEKFTEHSVTFFTSLITASLQDFPESAILNEVRKNALIFLLSNKSSKWSFNYWGRNAIENSYAPYPDDLDDTFCALIALKQMNPEIINGVVLAKILKILVSTEIAPGGPYKTWLNPPVSNLDSWTDVDIAVNANIGYFLSLFNVRLPSINKLIEDVEIISRYYPSIFPVLFFISHWYTGQRKQEFIELLLKFKCNDGSFGNPLLTSLAVSSLLNFGFPATMLINSAKYLLHTRVNNHWGPFAFCRDPVKQGNFYVAGSAALTTAFCLEALQKFINEEKLFFTFQSLIVSDESQLLTIVVAKFGNNFMLTHSALGPYALKKIEALIATTDGERILLLAFHFDKAVLSKAGLELEFLENLASINLYGWLAYDIYDDFLDGEGKVEELGVANFCLREVVRLAEEVGEGELYRRTLDSIDEANTWEVTHCRVIVEGGGFVVPDVLPDFSGLDNLANRSLGHGLGPVVILKKMGYGEDSEEVKAVYDFFKNYLAARQLNDDAHDWWEDLQKGFLNSASVEVLKKFGKKEVNFERDNKELRELFWYRVIPEIAQRVFACIDAAVAALEMIEVIDNPTKLIDLLTPLRFAAQKAIDESAKIKEFLQELA